MKAILNSVPIRITHTEVNIKAYNAIRVEEFVVKAVTDTGCTITFNYNKNYRAIKNNGDTSRENYFLESTEKPPFDIITEEDTTQG